MFRGHGSRRVALGVALCSVVVLVAAGFAAGSPTSSKTTVTVTLTDTGVKFSTTSLAPGKVTFSVTNTGKKPHYFAIGGHSSGTLGPGKKGTVTVTLATGSNSYFESNPLKSGTIKVGASGAASGSAAILAGKQVFETAGCKSCHTLKAAGATGTIGPDLDQIKPPAATVIQFVTNGYNGVGASVPMPSFKGTLSTAKIQDVAAFVYASTH